MIIKIFANIFGMIFAIFLEGFKRKSIARMQNRIGPKLWQPFYDLGKLLQKETLSKNLFFDFVPYAALLVSLSLFLFVPFPIIHFDLDFLVLGYLFILFDSLVLIAALSSRNPFAFHATARDVLLMIGYEIGLIGVLALFAAKSATLSLVNINTMLFIMPIACILLWLFGLPIVKITPFDITIAEPEISGNFYTEFSGRKLFALELGEFLKNGAFLFLSAKIFFGQQNVFLGSLLLMFLYALSQASSPRYEIFKGAKQLLLLLIILMVDFIFMV